MPVPEDRDTVASLQEHFTQTANSFAAMTNCQELYQKPVELRRELSLSSFPYCPGTVFGTEKIKAIHRVFPVATGDIQTFCFFIAPFALSLRPDALSSTDIYQFKPRAPHRSR